MSSRNGPFGKVEIPEAAVSATTPSAPRTRLVTPAATDAPTSRPPEGRGPDSGRKTSG